MRAGDCQTAVNYADLAFRKFKAQGFPPELQAKALYRKVSGEHVTVKLLLSSMLHVEIYVRHTCDGQGCALSACKQPGLAVAALQRAAKLSDGSPAVSAALTRALACVSHDWLAEVNHNTICVNFGVNLTGTTMNNY